MMRALIEGRMSRIPAVHFLGIKLVDVSEGRAVLELPFRPELCNSLGNIQGGFITALADAAGGMALYTLLPLLKPCSNMTWSDSCFVEDVTILSTGVTSRATHGSQR